MTDPEMILVRREDVEWLIAAAKWCDTTARKDRLLAAVSGPAATVEYEYRVVDATGYDGWTFGDELSEVPTRAEVLAVAADPGPVDDDVPLPLVAQQRVTVRGPWLPLPKEATDG